MEGGTDMASSLEMIRKQRQALQPEKEKVDEKTDTSKIEKPSCLSSEVRFYGIAELVEMLGCSRHTVLKLFGDLEFPAVDFGKRKVVESHALIEYFSRRRTKKEERYWRMEA